MNRIYLFLALSIGFVGLSQSNNAQNTLQVSAHYTAYIQPNNALTSSGPTLSNIGTDRNRCFFVFDLKDLPNGAVVSDCYVTMTCNGLLPDVPDAIDYEPLVGFSRNPQNPV